MTPGKIKYFAYGSNMHPLRLQQRVASRRFLAIARLAQYRLAFHKIGLDQSAKCNIVHTGDPVDAVYGVIYEMDSDHRGSLDKAESLGCGYDLKHLQLTVANRLHQVFCYVANPEYIDDQLKPFDWYLQLVLSGGRHHRLPAVYLSDIEATLTLRDADAVRAAGYFEIVSGL